MLVRLFLTALRLDRWLLAGVLLLSFAGLLNLAFVPAFTQLFYKQALFLGIGFISLLLLATWDYRWFRSSSLPGLLIWGTGVILLAITAFWGTAVRGAANWFFIGPISIGPIEIVKFGALLVLAGYFARGHTGLIFPTRVVLSSMVVIIPIGLALLQPDIGSAAILAALWFWMVVLLRIPFRLIAAIIFLAVLFSAFSWQYTLHDYQKERFVSFLSPQENLSGGAYQSHQALIAIGAGGVLGRGFFSPDLSSRLNFLPESATDFAFASLVEQVGLLGALVLLGAFLILFVRIERLAFRASNNFSCAYAIGLFGLLFTEVGLNIAMNLGLLPVTGVPLPLVSYGGSHTLMTFFALGILESIRLHQPEFVVRDRDAIVDVRAESRSSRGDMV